MMHNLPYWDIYTLSTFNTLINFICLFILVPKSKNRINFIIVILISLMASFPGRFLDFIGLFLVISTEIFILRNEPFKWTNKINLTFVSIVIATITQKIAYGTLKLTLGFDNQLLAIGLISLINLLLTLVLTYLGKYLIKRYLKQIPFNDTVVSSMNLISITIILIGSISLIMISHYITSQYLFLDATIIIIIVLIVFVILGSIQLISGHLKKLQADYALERIEESDLYISELERNYNDLRRFKHDYKNLLLSLSATIDNNASKETIEKILKSANIDLDTNFQLNNEEPFRIKNELIRGIVITKLIAAQKRNIATTTHIDDAIDIDTKYSVDITRMLGILFDNALEAVKDVTDPNITFSLVKNNDYEFILQNNTTDKAIDLKTIYKNGYSTKTSHSGLGLATVKKIIDSHTDFQLKTTWNDNIFTTIITIKGDQ